MNWAVDFAKNVFGLTLSPNYALVFLGFVLFVISFIVGCYYYIVFKGAVSELKNITWPTIGLTLKYTGITIITIIMASSLMFGYDYILDQAVSIIIK
jgi:preprotein translocase SecE subunit